MKTWKGGKAAGSEGGDRTSRLDGHTPGIPKFSVVKNVIENAGQYVELFNPYSMSQIIKFREK